MTDQEKLSTALVLLDEVRAIFRGTLKKEPASDWYQDAADVLDHPGIAPADRHRVALRLLSVAWKRLQQIDPDGRFESVVAELRLLATHYSLPATSAASGGSA